jgi:hypothetical protein
MFMLNTPGKLAALHPAQGIPMPDFDYTDLNRNKRVLETTFTGMGWRVAEFLAAARVASDMYFARVDVKRGAGSP